jgi:site-specific DNA-methyltransferase (adenine-specific)
MSEQVRFTLRGRNPDVLTCIANLSNDEVFTPPEFAGRMLDTVAAAWAADHSGANIWANPDVRFLDPFTKSGVFLREITTRLTEGLKDAIPDLQTRFDHIVTKQVFGIGITQLTALLARRSLYCSKHANGERSIAKSFSSDEGNIWFKRVEHSWVGGKCEFCGVGNKTLGRGAEAETHAYAFIHTHNIKTRIAELFGDDMQFDVIIGNPPYQLASDGGTRDIPIYNKFVEQAKKLEPRYLAMVIPSRWMASGLGLTEFRQAMLSDRHVRKLVDYPVASEIFPGVEIKGGACYFLWERDSEGNCEVTTVRGDEVVGPVSRDLGEHDVFVRDSRALKILDKVLKVRAKSITEILSVDKEFGWTSNFSGYHEKHKTGDIAIYFIRNTKRSSAWIGRKDIEKSAELTDTWKVMVPQAYGAGETIPHQILGQPFVAPNPSVCTQSYLFFYVGSERAAKSVESYVRTRFFRFLVSLRKITQHATRSTYTWVPQQKWNRTWSDEALYEMYGLTKQEVAFIESRVKALGSDDE